MNDPVTPQSSTVARLRNNLPLLQSSLSFSISFGGAAIGGFVFWLIAARVAPAETVGKAAALWSSTQFVNYATALGFPIAVARYGGSRRGQSSVLFNWSIILTVASSFVGAALYFAFVPRELDALSVFGVAGSILLFGLLVAGTSIGNILDVRLITQARRPWVAARATFTGLVRLPFILFVPELRSVVGIFLLAAGAPALSGFAAWVLADLRDGHFAFPLRPLPSNTASAVKYSAVNSVAQLAVQGPFYALPVIVFLIVTSGDNASFYVAWSIATVLFLVVQGVGQALLVEGNRSGRLEAQIPAALQLAVILASVLAVACALGSRVLPFLYGDAYRAAGTLLPLLGAAAIPWAVFSIALGATRVHHYHRRVLMLSTVFAVSVLVPAVFLVLEYGINGAGIAWLLGNIVAAVASAIVLRRLPKSPPAN